MARHQQMVSAIARNKIVFLGLLCVAIIIFLGIKIVFPAKKAIPQNSVFSASNDSLDLAVLDGMTQADHASTTNLLGTIRAIVVPHHLVASKSIALGIKSLARSNPKLIVLVSPDHFFHCGKLLCTTAGSFKTFFGNVAVSDDYSNVLSQHSDIVDYNQNLFIEEHGIYTIVPFINHYLPNAKILPIAVSQNGLGTESSRAETLEILQQILSKKDTALVISSDFSHYLPLARANEMDLKTTQAFCSGDRQAVLHLINPSQSDCPLCLWMALQSAQLDNFENPILIAHSNSANLLGDVSASETTSHFTYAFSTNPVDKKCSENLISQQSAISKEAKILFVGDMSFDRYIRQVSDKHGSDFIFSCLDPLLKKADAVVGNLEGPITKFPSKSEGTIIGSPENYQFTFPTTTAELLAKNNINIVNIGNNHIGDLGNDGIASTHGFLKAAGINYFGGLAGDEPIYETELEGIKLSFINYNQFGGDSPEKAVETISKERALGRIVIVYAHWGEEYSDSVTRTRSIAKLFAQSGAAIIMGSHPHIVLPNERIQNTIVYYSLGNFIFDQYFDSRVTNGLTVLAHISNSGVTTEEYPVILNKDGRTCIIPKV